MKEKSTKFFAGLKTQINTLSIVLFSVTILLLIMGTALFVNNNNNFVIEQTSYGKVLVSVTERGSEKTKLSIPNGVTHIGRGAFLSSMLSLTEINIPDSVKYIEYAAFNSCFNLEFVNFSKNSKLEIIEDEAFSECLQLKYFSMPESVQYVGQNAFNNDKKLVVYLNNSNPSVQPYTFQNVKAIITSESNYEAMPSMANLYKKENLVEDKFIIESNILKKYIGRDGVVYIPNNVTEILTLAFSHDSFAEKIVFNSNLTKIGNNAFQYAEKITELEIPANVTEIGDYAFQYMKLLTKVKYNSNANISVNMFYNCNQLKEITFNSNLTVIGASAFSECRYLHSIILPETLTSIQSHAFYKTALTEIIIPESVLNIETFVFRNCTKLEIIKIKGKFSIPTTFTEYWNSLDYSSIIPHEFI